MKNFTGRPFFSLFFIARANQKIPNLALGRESTKGAHNTGPCIDDKRYLSSTRSDPIYRLFIDVVRAPNVRQFSTIRPPALSWIARPGLRRLFST
jgi:hypothetical protein